MAEPHKSRFSGKIAPPLVAWLAFLAPLTPSPTFADEQDWLPPGSSMEMRGNPPAEIIRPDAVRDEKWLYGRLLFHSPAILGEKAVRIGLSCNSCHANGHINSDFFISGLSDAPGRVDVTHRFWKAGSEDGTANPLDIPSLRGSHASAPYGTARVFSDLGAFTTHVIVTEFAGPTPDAEKLGALVAYMESLDHEEIRAQAEMLDVNYIPLLERPLEHRDLARLDELYQLIRSDYGRRAAEEKGSAEEFRRNVTMLGEIKEKAAAKDFAAALAIYQELLAAQ